MDGIGANGLFQASAFFKSYNGKRVKDFFTTFFACYMCQSFARTCFKFRNVRLYVTENCIHYLWGFR